jgi:hypothetical protein
LKYLKSKIFLFTNNTDETQQQNKITKTTMVPMILNSNIMECVFTCAYIQCQHKCKVKYEVVKE